MKKIVVLNASSVSDGTWSATCVFWLNAPVNNKVPRPGFKSKADNVPADVLAALESGELVERVDVTPLFPADYTLEDAQDAIEEFYELAQAYVHSTNPPVAGLVGTSYDGTSWA